MHIADNILPAGVCAAGALVAAGGVKLSLRHFREDRVSEVGVLTGIFFVATLIRVPLAGTSVHLLLNGLLGIVLGWLSPLSIVVGLAFQAVLLGHGGFTTLGVNAVVSAAGALASHAVFRGLGGRAGLGLSSPAAAAFAASLAGFASSAALYVLAMASGGESLLAVAGACLAIYAPVAAIEALATAYAVAFIAKVRPELVAIDSLEKASEGRASA